MSAKRFLEHPLCRPILSELARSGPLSFADLSGRLEAPYARLSAGIAVLKDADWIVPEVILVGRGLRMNYRLTWQGRAAVVVASAAAASSSDAASVA